MLPDIQKALPKGWKMARLAEVANCLDGQRKPINEVERENRKGHIPYYGANGQVGWIDDYLFDQKLLLIAEDGGYWGANEQSSYIINGKSWVNNHAHVLAENGKALLEFLNCYLFVADLRKHISGTTRGKLNKQSLLKIQIPLPPLPAQHKIVEILEEADNLRKLRQQADEKMKDLIPSLFVQMFGDPVKNPKGWGVKRLGDVVDKVSLQIMPTDYPDTEFVYIGLEHIESNTGQLAKINYQSGESIKSSKNKFKKGDILYGKLRPYLNKVWLADRSGICSTDIWVIKPIKDKTTGYFISTFLRFQQIVKRLNSKTEGANLPRVKTESFNKIPVPLPPLPLQQEFVRLIEDIEAEKARQAESRKNLDKLFNSLMQRAFTGELVA